MTTTQNKSDIWQERINDRKNSDLSQRNGSGQGMMQPDLFTPL